MPLIVIVLAAQAAVTPAGSPVAAPIPVAPVVAWVIAVSAVLIQSVGVDDAAPTVLFASDSDCSCCINNWSASTCKWYGIIKGTPAAVGVPLIVIVLAAQAACYSCR